MLEILYWLLRIAILLSALFAVHFIYTQFIRPTLTVRYYKSQGCLHVKLAGWNSKKDLMENAKKYGDGLGPIFETAKANPDANAIILQIGQQVMIQLTSPALIKEFYSKELTSYKTSSTVDIFRIVVGDAILFYTGEAYKKQRKLMAQPFHFDFLKAQISSVEKQALESLKEIAEGNLSSFNAIVEFRRFMGAINTYIFMGENIDNYTIDGMNVIPYLNDSFGMLGKISHSSTYKIFGLRTLKAGIFPSHAAVLRRSRLIHETYRKVFKQKEKEYLEGGPVPQEKKNLLQFFVDAKTNQSDIKVTDEMIVSRFVDMTVAGMENTGKAVALSLCYLYQNPEMRKKIEQEADQQWPKDTPITLEIINACKYLHAFMKEVLRFGTNFGSSLEATEDNTLQKINIKKGQFVGVSFAFVHANPKFYKNPLEFDPERYLRKDKDEGLNNEPLAWLPFGAGPRDCLGKNLALVNMKIMLLHFLRKFDFELPEGYKVQFTISLVRTLLHEPIFKLKPKV